MKLFASILTILLLGFLGFATTIFISLLGYKPFYLYFIPIFTIAVIIMIIFLIYGKAQSKLFKRCTMVFITAAIVSIVSYEGYEAYEKSLEVVSTQDVDLTEYTPFVEGSKLVSLEEPSTLKIADDLPKLDGATALYPVYSAFAQAVYPKKDYSLHDSEVVSSQTSGAFDRLLKGDVDLIFIAQPSEKQMRNAEELGIELNLTPIGREAFVFFVHSKNPINELTMEQIQAIYSGKITNWRQLGGKNEEIRAFQRPEGSGSQSALINVMGDVPLMEPPSEDIVSAMGGIITETTNYQNRTNAIGFSFRHFSQNMVENGKIKYIAINGMTPSKENIQNDSYPIVAPLYAVTTSGNTNPHVEGFINWMLSEQGQYIVEQTGYVPVK
ncbi:substrate-binding domain-containing protein [Robertmurraya sp. DFI.2.37]|uniref:PstS family phosphate ABC transporter substrate-binding protein n=1 Tax=Robertmurraya sp. DFI.2.37 TaxID=3031819 RepID=UPI001248E1D5|nr:substrate-binding domain-containing protein [Robertmurraya sp. DFI.2.37]MDF1508472.1 substrate-binding domain-containing protein [Robertmurraya sp. DFI.2.37]